MIYYTVYFTGYFSGCRLLLINILSVFIFVGIHRICIIGKKIWWNNFSHFGHDAFQFVYLSMTSFSVTVHIENVV